MSRMTARTDALVAALEAADIRVGGERPWDVRVLDERLWGRVASRGIVGLGDAYADGWWECDALDVLYDKALSAGLPDRFRNHPRLIARMLFERLVNLQTRSRASRNGRRHYDLGNDLFEAMLDPTMAYSCGYWRDANTLHEAQRAKFDLVCRKAGLHAGTERGKRVLDIGCGWGGFVEYAARERGVRCVGVTVSEEQADCARRRCAGLPVEIRLADYREINEPFDAIVSIGMFEHVGPKNHRTFMRIVERCLGPGGLAVLHFFATQRPWPNTRDSEVLWVTKNIFPGIVVPTLGQVGRAVDGLLVTEDLENFGADYDPTLMAWHENFEKNRDTIRDRYGERFCRMWSYYLKTCAGAFRSRKYQVWQLVLSPAGVRGGYRRPSAGGVATVEGKEVAEARV